MSLRVIVHIGSERVLRHRSSEVVEGRSVT
jgi:hypothetical protein